MVPKKKKKKCWWFVRYCTSSFHVLVLVGNVVAHIWDCLPVIFLPLLSFGLILLVWFDVSADIGRLLFFVDSCPVLFRFRFFNRRLVLVFLCFLSLFLLQGFFRRRFFRVGFFSLPPMRWYRSGDVAYSRLLRIRLNSFFVSVYNHWLNCYIPVESSTY